MGESGPDVGPRGFSASIAENRLADDWLVFVALAPCIAIAIATAIYVAAATAWHTRLVQNAPSVPWNVPYSAQRRPDTETTRPGV